MGCTNSNELKDPVRGLKPAVSGNALMSLESDSD